MSSDVNTRNLAVRLATIGAGEVSNPTVTAKENPGETGGFLHFQFLRGAFVVRPARRYLRSRYSSTMRCQALPVVLTVSLYVPGFTVTPVAPLWALMRERTVMAGPFTG